MINSSEKLKRKKKSVQDVICLVKVCFSIYKKAKNKKQKTKTKRASVNWHHLILVMIPKFKNVKSNILTWQTYVGVRG
jgi:hypothetical protein